MKVYDKNLQEFNYAEYANGDAIWGGTFYEHLLHIITTHWRKDINVMFDISYSMFTQFDADLYNKAEVDLIILAHCDHDYTNDENLTDTDYIKYLDQITKPVIFLHYNKINSSNALYCPFWPMYFVKELGTRLPTDAQIINPNRQYIYSCLSNRPKDHRLINLAAMKRYNNLNSSVVTMDDRDQHFNERRVDIADFASKTGIESVWPGAAHEISLLLPITHPEIKTPRESTLDDIMGVINSAYLDTYVNIIAEHEDSTFISEKTLKPIIAGQLFVTISPPGTLRILQDFGFDTFDDIIDHSRYANHTCIFRRTQELHILLNEMADIDWREVYVNTQQRRWDNRKLLLQEHVKNDWVKRFSGIADSLFKN